MKIIFQDIDGPLIPHRMYYTGFRPYDTMRNSFVWDPIAVQMINRICEICDAKVVFNTAHCENPAEIMKHQAACNGLKFLHEDCKTSYPFTDNRYQAITEWLDKHNTISDWIVIDDVQVCLSRQIKVDWKVGMTIENYRKACQLLGHEIKIEEFIGKVSHSPNLT